MPNVRKNTLLPPIAVKAAGGNKSRIGDETLS
jgi:hypothetical protein